VNTVTSFNTITGQMTEMS